MKNSLFALTLIASSTIGCDDPDNSAASAPAPAGYSEYVVYIADGTWDPADPNAAPPVLDDFLRDSWGWSDAEVQQFQDEAKQFLIQRFGIDVDDPANAERVYFFPNVVDPRAHYRVVTFANREVPPEGWPVADAGWGAAIIDPNGFELGGEFAGITVPVGAVMGYGRYQIETHTGESIGIYFQSQAPGIPDQFGAGMFRCELSSDEFGAGEAAGMYRQTQQPNGDFTYEIRNVLTFE